MDFSGQYFDIYVGRYGLFWLRSKWGTEYWIFVSFWMQDAPKLIL
jgi:hypothetical protein